MAGLPTPVSKVQMDPNFEGQLRALQTQAAAEATARKTGDQAKWMRPTGWLGDAFDLAAMGVPFSRAAANTGYEAAVKDASAPGTSGDIIAATAMVDYLATMEQAFRARQTLRRCRATAHLIGRKVGHGDPRGPLVQCGIEWLAGVMAQARVKT
jgi:hypothetical protein